MSTKSEKAKKNAAEKAALIANLSKVWPEAEWKGVTKAELLWLAEIAVLRAKVGKRQMGEILAQYRVGYENSHTPSGRASKRCGDDLSKLLTGLDGTQTIRLAERVLELEADFLFDKYSSLNEGQRRMNAGNRLRGGIKRGDYDLSHVKAVLKAAA
jgi:hypothetical protein